MFFHQLITIRSIIKIMAWILIILGLMGGLLVTLIRTITFHPPAEQAETIVCTGNAPVLQPGQTIKILTYNVQYMAGKNYVFFYDLPNDAGPDERPSPADISRSVSEVARIIRDEDPDIILLQEVDDGSRRTDYEDQLTRLLSLLPEAYACHTSAFYWQATFVPHPRIMGAIGHKLSTISKYRLEQATRYQLPLAPADPLTRQFSPKRAILAARLPVAGDKDLVVLNTHLEVSRQGTDVKQAEIAQIDEYLTELTRTGQPWLLGGDFNLLPPGQFNRLPEEQRGNFRPETELERLFDSYRVIPSFEAVNSDQYPQWLTMFPNDPRVTKPDRTLDYVFFGDRMTLTNAYVRQSDTLHISDHLPVIGEFQLP